MFVDAVERAISGNELLGPLLADAGHARNIIDSVAEQRQIVSHRGGREAEFLLKILLVVVPEVADALRGPHDLDGAADDLKEVLVGRENFHMPALGRRFFRRGDDKVVGLDAVADKDRHSHGAADLDDERHLGLELLGSRFAPGLVIFVYLLAPRGSVRIKKEPHSVDSPFVEAFRQHVREADQRVRRRAVSGRQRRRQRVKAPESEPVSVYQKQFLTHLNQSSAT